MEAFEVVAGDVLLLERRGGRHDPLSELIQRVTGSPYSHSLLALGPGRFVHANPAAGGDVEILDDPDLQVIVDACRRVALFRLQAAPADPAALDEAARDLHARALQAGDPVAFSDGALVGLAVLRLLDALPSRTGPVGRLRAALFVALEDGDRRLFCSELVHRVMDRAGCRPVLPVRPVISFHGFPTDEGDAGHGKRAPFVDVAFAWLRSRWGELLSELGLTDESFEMFDEVLRRTRDAYVTGAAVPLLEVANFITPADFAGSPSLRLGAHREPGQAYWTPIDSERCPG